MKYLYAILAGAVLALAFSILERESVLVEDSIRKDPPISRMGYPCETWIRQTGGGPPIFSCVKASKR